MPISRDALLRGIDADRGANVDLLSRIIQIPSENPPGDTTNLARFVAAVLDSRRLPYQVFEPRPGNPNIVATIGGAGRGTHLVLNGHLDVFPADDPSLWNRPPFSGAVEGGKVHGRGAADMKAGTTASLITFLRLAEVADQLPGRLTLTLVSDEETGGQWGAAWLLDHHSEYVGDALLNAEPSGLDTLWIGEKGIAWMRLISVGETGHGASGRGDNAITRLAEAILLARGVTDIQGTVPEEIRDVLSSQARNHAAEDLSASDDLLTRCSVNVGVVSGGIKTNVVPLRAEADVDIRIPFGVTQEQVLADLEGRLERAGLHQVRVEPVMQNAVPASIMSPNDPLVGLVRRNAQEIAGVEPQIAICRGGTDGRFWRIRGVPTIIYGPGAYGVAAPNEYIEIDDYQAIIKIHTATAIDFLGGA
jgi:acetylornithine deacetylase/succinyl-diaminopimelate desuccinylase family protein